MFKHRKESLTPEKIASMRASGMSDRDIIKKLKGLGYSYDEIEKAMLSSLKSEVSSSKHEEKPTPTNHGTDVENIFEPPQVKEEQVAPIETLLEPEQQPGLFQEPEPELSIEELVEGVINEKWEIFEKELRNLKFDQEKLVKEIEEIKNAINKLSEEKQNPVLEKKINELNKRFDELDSRVSGLEKAFRQFLPSLVQNVRILSELIDKMKKKKVLNP